jgi:hypothetical protein
MMHSSEQKAPAFDLRPFAALAVSLCLGLLGGYFVRGALEPEGPGSEVEALGFVERGSKTAFPYTFENRGEAMNWLRSHIAFLDRHAGYGQRQVVDRFKQQLAIVESQPGRKIEQRFFQHVREEAELLRGELGGRALYDSLPLTNPPHDR